MSKVSAIFRIILIVAAIALLCSAAVASRDYQDSWVLEGLEIPFAIFIVIYIAYFFLDKDEKIVWIVTFAVIVRAVILLVPTLKYSWFRGTQYDVMYIFNMYRYVNNAGFLPSPVARPDMLYLPMSSIWLSSISFATGLPQTIVFKYFTPMFTLPYPLIIYMIAKRLGGSQRTIRYSVFIASIPVDPAISTLANGSLFGCLLFVLTFACIIQSLRFNRLSYHIITLFAASAVILFHSYSSVLLMVGLVMTYILCSNNLAKNIFTFLASKIHIMSRNARTNIREATSEPAFLPLIIFITALEMLYVTILAPNLLTVSGQIAVKWVSTILGISAKGPPTTYLEQLPALASLSLANISRVIIVYFGGVLFLIFLTFVGIIVTLRKPDLSKYLFFVAIFLLSVWILYFGQLILTLGKSGLIEYSRIFRYTAVLSPIFVGILFSHLKSKKLTALIVCIMVLLGTLQMYGYQPLLPIASTVRRGLPSNEYIVYVGVVNSAYQRCMINFAQEHIYEGEIVSDPITSNQIIGFTDYDFYMKHYYYYASSYPFSASTGANTTILYKNTEFDYFLIHFLGKSGKLEVKPEVETRAFITEVLDHSSILYSNEESFVLGKPFQYTQLYNSSDR